LRLPVGPLLPIAKVVEMIGRRLAPRADHPFTPGALRHLQQQRRADITKARRELGYEPTSVSAAIEEQHAFFVHQGWIPPRPGPA
jgi:nucleoside-diphosphate-sugar epimerase